MAVNPLDTFTNQAVRVFGHGAAREYQRRLKEDRSLCGTHCKACGRNAFPPRDFCPDCFESDCNWVTIGDGATLYAFTTQHRGLRFTAPDVIGVVDVPDVGLVVTPLSGRLDELQIGQAMKPEVVDINEKLSTHRFIPA